MVEAAVNDGIWDRNLRLAETICRRAGKASWAMATTNFPTHDTSFFDLVHPDDRPAICEAPRAHLEEDKPYALDIRLRCKSGDYLLGALPRQGLARRHGPPGSDARHHHRHQ